MRSPAKLLSDWLHLHRCKKVHFILIADESPAKLLSNWLYLHRCKKVHFSVIADERINIWRDLAIWRSTNINPFDSISESEVVPSSLIKNYYPGEKKKIRVDNKIVEIDIIKTTDLNIQQAEHFVTTSQGNDGNEIACKARKLYLVGGGNRLSKGEMEIALRAYLNAIRLGVECSAWINFNIAKCLQELGCFEESAVLYIEAAECFSQEDKTDEAADTFERAGLLFEALRNPKERPEYGTNKRFYNSTICFQKAKHYFSLIGDYDSTSRCFILERDAHRRWTYSKIRKIELGVMRKIWLYGESPIISLRTVFLIWFMSAVLFFFCGFQWHGNEINYDFALSFDFDAISDFFTSLYFSAVTISTLGYGDCEPGGTASRILSGLEAFSGILCAAMLLVSIQRRYVGR